MASIHRSSMRPRDWMLRGNQSWAQNAAYSQGEEKAQPRQPREPEALQPSGHFLGPNPSMFFSGRK